MLADEVRIRVAEAVQADAEVLATLVCSPPARMRAAKLHELFGYIVVAPLDPFPRGEEPSVCVPDGVTSWFKRARADALQHLRACRMIEEPQPAWALRYGHMGCHSGGVSGGFAAAS